MFAAGRKAAAGCSSQSVGAGEEGVRSRQQDEDWLSSGKSFSSGTGDEKAHAAELSGSGLRVYKHRHRKHRHKEKKEEKKEQKSLAATSRNSRHLSKHKKKSKDKKRKRPRSRSNSSDDDGDDGSGRRSPRRRQRSRSNPHHRSRSQTRGHQEENRIITETTKEIALHVVADGEDDIFELDCVGDRNNHLFGSTYVHDRPLYELATRRNFLTGSWLSHKQPTYATPKRQTEGKDSDRYFSLQARKAEKDARQKRLYLAYSERRSGRAAANEDLGHSQDNQVGSHVLSHPPEMNFIPLDPLVDVSELEDGGVGEEPNYNVAASDGEKGILLSNGQSVEQYLVQRNKVLNRAVAANPHDIDAWLDLMVFQEQTMRLHTKTKKMNSAMKASVEDKQAAILAKALASNPQSRELHRVKLNMSLHSQASDDYDSFHLQLESLLTEDLTNSELWIKLLQSRQQHFGCFSMQSVRDLYARILSVLRAEHENVAKEAAAPTKSPLSVTDLKGKTGIESRDLSLEKLSFLLLDFHFLMCVFEKKAGFVERSIAQIQALIDFSINNCAGTAMSGSTGAHLDLLQKFAVRWNDGSTVGFGSEGWKNFTSTDCTFEDDPPHLFAPEVEEHIRTTCATTLDQVNPPEVLRTKEHKQSLLCASAKYKRKSRIKGGTKSEIFGERSSVLWSSSADFYANDDSEIESRTGGKHIYSNLHGYRISVDDADDTKEYERILGELRSTETARTRQDQLLEKETMKRSMLAVTESEVEDQRANYDMIEEGDRFVKWLVHEEVQTELQWAPLRSSNPLHHELIEQQPDRAILTEEIQPFLFPVLGANQWRLIAELLHICGVKWRGEYAWENNLQVFQSMYADDGTDSELLVAPILSVLDPQALHSKKQTLFLKPHDRNVLLQSALLDDVAVEQRVLCDSNKVSFVRRAFTQALGVFYNADKDLASTLKCLWISFEAEVVRTDGGEEADLVYARRLSQRLAQKTSNDDTDYNVLYAYAKLELKLGNKRQVRRICESTLTSIGTPQSSNAAMARYFHRFVFLRARLEMWPSSDEVEQNTVLTRDQERLRVLRCLYTLRDVWRPDCKEKETLDAITKKHRKRTRAFLEEQLMSDPSIGASLIARYRTELGIAIRQCVEVTPRGCEDHTTSDRPQFRTTCWAGYCLHNLALVVYAFRGLEAACHEYRQALVKPKHRNCSHQAWMWTCFLEFMQQHQASCFFPVVAPRAWRSSVSQAVEKFPKNALFLRLFVDAETGNTISQVLRNYFLRVEKRWQRYYDSPELVEWLFALLCEVCRVERAATIKNLSDTALSNSNKPSRPLCCLFHRWGMNATAVGRIRQMFESMVNHIRTKGNALCWRLYMRFEVALGKVDAAKKILYRGVSACAWSKALYMDGLRMLRVYLSEDECKELFDLMEAKELNIRADLEAMVLEVMQERDVSSAAGGGRKGPESTDPVVRRLAAVTGAEWSVAGILNEVLPEQRNLCDARCLLESRLRHNKVFDIKRPQAAEDKRKRHRSVVPLQIVSSVPKQPAISHSDKRSNLRTSSDSFRGHVLSVWEDKFRLKCLAVEDALLLLAQPNVASTLESASFLREVRLTYDQVMELEMALAMLRRQKELADCHSPKQSSSSRRATIPLCKILARNAWYHGRTFSVAQTLPEVITFKRLTSSSSTQISTAFSSIRARPKYSSKLHDKGYDTTHLSVRQMKAPSRIECIPIGPNFADQKVCPQNIRNWVRDHCMDEVARSVTIRQNFAVEKLFIIFSKHYYQSKHRRFSRWHQQVTWMQCDEQIRRFCRLKCALWVLRRSRKKLENLVIRLWSSWMLDTAHQREDETIAAAVTIQSWVRSVNGKRTAAVHHLHQTATSIQAGWRGFYCRKMFKRMKRFYEYSTAAHHVQRCYHSHVFRERFDAWMRYQRAARVITRAFKHYIEKRRDFVAWCHRLARYHAIIAIQIWTRRTLTRIRCGNTKRERVAKARQVVFSFLRRSRFVRCFAMRVDRTLKRKTAAAVLLQNAYRAKQARARFYELKVRLEDQRRQEILTTMWNNAYATTIQKRWRKRKYLQRRQQQSSE